VAKVSDATLRARFTRAGSPHPSAPRRRRAGSRRRR
jgi:hypothetical protein